MADNVSVANVGSIQVGNLTVNRLGLGTNRIRDNEHCQTILKRAVELGINFIDTARVYTGGDSEVAIGNALSPYKNHLVVATKGGMGNGASPGQLRKELQESLGRLKTDHIDLYQLHRVDPETPLTESVRALKQFCDEGLVGNIGLSNVSTAQIEMAMEIAPIASVQNEYNLANRKYDDVVDYCTANKIALIPWSPLGGFGDDTLEVQALVTGLAVKYNATAQQIALAWLLKRSPMVLPIPGTTSLKHLEANVQATSIELSDEDFEHLSRA